jgi:hypothetical protein
MKSVFYVVALGKQLAEKIERAIQAYQGTIYSVPDTAAAIELELEAVRSEQDDHRTVITSTKADVVSILQAVAFKASDGTSPLRDWQVALKKVRRRVRVRGVCVVEGALACCSTAPLCVMTIY